MENQAIMGAAALYILIGTAMSMVGGAWRPLADDRTGRVRVLQIAFLVTLWLPALMYHLITGHEENQS